MGHPVRYLCSVVWMGPSVKDVHMERGGQKAGDQFDCSVEKSVDFSVEFLSLIN